MRGIYTVYCKDYEVFFFVVNDDTKPESLRNKLLKIKDEHGIDHVDIEPFFEVIE